METKHTVNDIWVIEKIREESISSLNLIKIGNTTCQNLWDTANTVLRRKFILIKAYIKKNRDISNNLMI
jgi:hypothetical protein